MIKYFASVPFLVFLYLAFFCWHGPIGLVYIVVSTVLVLGAMITNQNKIMYLPCIPTMPQYPEENSLGLRHPKERNIKSIEIELTSSDGIKLRGWHLLSQPKPERLTIFFQDNAGNIGLKLPFVQHLINSTKSDVVLVAYRGYSHSQGKPEQEGLKKDAQAVVDYAIQYGQTQKITDIFVYGRSLGGAVAINVCSNPKYTDKIAGIMLENTFTSIEDILDTLMPVFKPIKRLQVNQWRSIDLIGKISAPIYFIKSMRDPIVNVEHMHKLQRNAVSSRLIDELRILDGTHHDVWHGNPSQFFTNVFTFVDRVAAHRTKLENNK